MPGGGDADAPTSSDGRGSSVGDGDAPGAEADVGISPADDADATAEGESTEESVVADPEATILHVDGDEDFRELTAASLGSDPRRFRVLGEPDPTAALERLPEVDCVVSEHALPGMDGLELLERVRRSYPDLPFVLFTGGGSEALASEAIGAGVTDYLPKDGPESLELLADRLEAALDESGIVSGPAESETGSRRAESETGSGPAESESVSGPAESGFRTNQVPFGMLERISDGLMALDTEWRFTYVNETAAEVFDARPADLLGRSLWEVAPEARETPFYDHYREAMACQEPAVVEEYFDPWDRWYREYLYPSADGLSVVFHDVTERKRRQADLQRYRTLVETVGDPMYVLSPEATITFANRAMAEYLGAPREEIVGSHASAFMTDESFEQGNALVAELLEADDREWGTYEITVVTADDERRIVEANVAVLVEEGTFRGSVGVIRDIADRKRYEAQLTGLHEVTRRLFRADSPSAIADRATAVARGVVGLPVHSIWLYDSGADALVHERSTPAAADLLDDVPDFARGEGLAWEVFESGEPQFHGDVSAVAGRYNDETPIRSEMLLPLGDHGVLIAGSPEADAFDDRDVTLAKVLAANVEAALDRADKERALRRERDDLAALFENIPDPSVEVTMRDGRPIVSAVNPAFEEVFGHANADIVGEDLDEFIVPPGEEVHPSAYNDRIEEGEGFHGEVRRIAADGLRDFILHVAPHDVGEEATRGYAIYTDITERKRRERELARQNERLDQFASVVSHDLRNPLSVATGNLELVADECDADGIERVARAHDRMEALIEDLLRLARAGDDVDEVAPVPLAAAVQRAWGGVRTDGATLEVDAVAASVVADENRLGQLFENLFRNAVEHARPDVTVRVGRLEDGFFVADDGPGIPADERDRVLEAGYSRTEEGTGFGLAIVERIASAHGWSVALVESADGGARFEFTGVAFEG